MKIAIIGANGQLGSDLVQASNNKDQIIPLEHCDLDIADIDRVRATMNEIRPDVVINTAAFHNVPLCEKEPMKSFEVNGLGPFNLARISNDLSYILVHYSTDYVFDGLKHAPYNEDDRENPMNLYSITKLAGEHLVKSYCNKYYIIRISGIYGKVPCRAKGGNFITTMVKMSKEKPVVRVVDDEILTPTPTEEIARNSFPLIKTGAFGLYHMSCEGECSWYQFAKIIFKTLKLKTPLEPCSVKEYSSPVKRPHYSVLENQNLKKINLNLMGHWEKSLLTFLKDFNPA